ncbi:MAG: SDR family oxidoreductase [Anaerolineaceae bacterium]|nr:SDR family oxidoreductase [Anaerolineaceae bacterium]
MTGKVVLITGGTSGIGEITATELARKGAEVVIVGRNAEKLDMVVNQVKSETGNAKVSGLLADLSVLAQVRKLADDFKARHNRLDVLVNNAGAVLMKHEVSADGYEMTFALNHLNYFLLTHCLLDVLKASAPARIVNVSSMAHLGARLNFDDLQNEKKYSGWAAYSQSKLANVYFTYELARRLDGTGVTVNVLHPGFVATNFGRSNGGLLSAVFKLFQIGAITPKQGAETSIYLASSPEVEGVTGKYFVKKMAARSSDVSYDESAARKLWEISEKLTQVS